MELSGIMKLLKILYAKYNTALRHFFQNRRGKGKKSLYDYQTFLVKQKAKRKKKPSCYIKKKILADEVFSDLPKF